MLVRHLQPPVCTFPNGSHLTINRRITGQVAKAAVGRATSLARTIKSESHPDAALQHASDALVDLDLMIDAQARTVKTLHAASDVLRGRPAIGNGDLLCAAMNISALSGAIGSVQPDLDLAGEDVELADQIDEAASAIRSDMKVATERRAKARRALKEASGIAMSLATTDAADLYKRFGCPSEWTMDGPDFRKLARLHLSRKEVVAERAKAARQAEELATLQERAAGVWTNV